MPSPQPQPARVPTPLRPPWWVPVVAIFGAVSFLAGIMFLLRLRSPGPHSHSVAIAAALIIAGIILVPVAWMKRVRRASPMAAERRALEADNQPIPPREA